MKSLKQRLEDSNEIKIKLEADAISVEDKPQTVTCQTQPSPPEPSDSGASAKQAATARSTVSESVTAGSSATATSDVVVKEDSEKLRTECATDSTVALKANESVKFEEGSQTAPAATAEENLAKLPKIDETTFKILTAAVRQHRLTRETTIQSSEKEVTLCF